MDRRIAEESDTQTRAELDIIRFLLANYPENGQTEVWFDPDNFMKDQQPYVQIASATLISAGVKPLS